MKEEYKHIVEHYGINNQLKKLSEEVYELQEAVLIDDGSTESKEHITEEWADVMNVLLTIMAHYDLNEYEVKELQEFKIERQLKRISEEN